MKITKQQLKRIIKEELESMLESPAWDDELNSASDRGVNNEPRAADIVFLPLGDYQELSSALDAAYKDHKKGSSEISPKAKEDISKVVNSHELSDYRNNLVEYNRDQWLKINKGKISSDLNEADEWLLDLINAIRQNPQN